MSTPSDPGNSSAHAQILQLLGGKLMSDAISLAAEIGIADLLANGDKTPEELGAATSIHPPYLYELLHVLANYGILAETNGSLFTLTPLAQCLRSDDANSIRNFVRFGSMPATQTAWKQLLHSVKTGEPGFQKALPHGKFFEYLAAHPEEAEIFDGAMTDLTRLIAPTISEAYPFARFETIVDVGGGQGLLLATILKRYPNLRGVLFDLPEVVGRAGKIVAAHGVEERCEVKAGNFFEAVPGNADAYLLKNVLHFWDDERSLAILRNIHRVVSSQCRLIVIELVVPPGNLPSIGKLVDLEMLTLTGGFERTITEYRDLFAVAGFRLIDVHSTDLPYNIMECALASA